VWGKRGTINFNLMQQNTLNIHRLYFLAKIENVIEFAKFFEVPISHKKALPHFVLKF